MNTPSPSLLVEGTLSHATMAESVRLYDGRRLPISVDLHADPEAQRAFASEIFEATSPLRVRPTMGDLAYIRRHGERFADPGLYGRVRGTVRECFGNAYRAANVDPSLTYVQGFVRGHADLIYPHAWCVDRRGRLIELTWDCAAATGGERYFGVRFTRRQLAILIVQYGNLDWYEGFSSVIGVESSQQTMGER